MTVASDVCSRRVCVPLFTGSSDPVDPVTQDFTAVSIDFEVVSAGALVNYQPSLAANELLEFSARL